MKASSDVETSNTYENIARRLGETADEVLDLEEAIFSASAINGQNLSPEVVGKLQNLDRVHQTLLDLALLIRLLNVDTVDIKDTSEHLKLESTKALLGVSANPKSDQTSGSLDLF